MDHLPADRVLSIGNGVFHSRAEEPTDRDQLLAALTDWLPNELLANVDISDPNLLGQPLWPSPTMPPGLAGSD